MVTDGHVMLRSVAPLPTESQLADVLAHRTVLLHVEIKRLRAWWRKILKLGLPRKLAGHAFVQVRRVKAFSLRFPFAFKAKTVDAMLRSIAETIGDVNRWE